MGQRGASSTTSAGVGQRGGKREGEEEGGGRREVNGKESMRAEGAYPHAQSGRRSRDMNHFCCTARTGPNEGSALSASAKSRHRLILKV